MKAHGPLDPDGPLILESLSFFPEDKKEKIEKAGGLAKLLVNSGHFAIRGHLLCPSEEVGVIEASMRSSAIKKKGSSNSNGQNFNPGGPGAKENRRQPPQSHRDEGVANLRVKNARTEVPPTKKISLGGGGGAGLPPRGPVMYELTTGQGS